MARYRLTERISIEKYLGEIQNKNGFDYPKWDDKYYKCWSAYKSVDGKEYIAAKANNTENIVTFTVRYCNKTKALLVPGATKNFRINYKGYHYDIEFVSDYKNLHEWIDIKCNIRS